MSTEFVFDIDLSKDKYQDTDKKKGNETFVPKWDILPLERKFQKKLKL